MATQLRTQKCVPCEGGIPPFTEEQIAKHLQELEEPEQWQVIDNKKLRRKFTFKTFMGAMEFVNKIAEIAEQQGHHPDIYIYYTDVEIMLRTHAIDGLHLNDFIIASQIEELLEAK